MARMPRAGRPSWPDTAAMSAAAGSLSVTGRLRRRAVGRLDRRPEPGIPLALDQHRQPVRTQFGLGLAGLVDHDIAHLARQYVPEPLASLRLDVRRVLPQAKLRLKFGDLSLEPLRFGAQFGPLAVLVVPRPQRIGI